MSESVATNRALKGAEEFDRRRRTLASTAPVQDDPLAELARLVGQDDPFRGLSPQIRPLSPARSRQDHDEATDFSAFDDAFLSAPDIGEEPGAPDDPAVVHAAAGRPAASDVDGYPPLSVRGERAPDLSSDAWARGGDIAPMPAAVLTATREQPVAPESRGSSQRTLIVLAAVVALTGGGLAASFLAKPAGSITIATSPSTSAAPTILAATGPSKVQPETPAADPDAPSEPSTLLDKNKNDGTATAKVVDSVEQPVDLNQAVKPAQPAQQAVADETPATAAPSPFPEPRKVKTILVRPDGSVITDRPAATDAVPTNTISEQASLAFDPKTSLPIIASPSADAAPAAPPPSAADAPAVATPPVVATPPGKSQARIAPTPKASTPKPDGTAADAKPTATPKAKAAILKPAAPKSAVQEANASPAPPADTGAATPAGGRFGVQIGTAGSDAEARDLSSRLGKKFASDIDAGHLAVHKAQVGDKTVYRIRVGGLSQDAAKALCGKVSAGGGGCFVTRD